MTLLNILSALKENEAYLDSIQGRIDLFNNAVQTMWMNFIDTDTVKFVVDLGTGLIQAADSAGVLTAAIAGLLVYLNASKKNNIDFAEMLGLHKKGDDLLKGFDIFGKEGLTGWTVKQAKKLKPKKKVNLAEEILGDPKDVEVSVKDFADAIQGNITDFVKIDTSEIDSQIDQVQLKLRTATNQLKKIDKTESSYYSLFGSEKPMEDSFFRYQDKLNEVKNLKAELANLQAQRDQIVNTAVQSTAQSMYNSVVPPTEQKVTEYKSMLNVLKDVQDMELSIGDESQAAKLIDDINIKAKEGQQVLLDYVSSTDDMSVSMKAYIASVDDGNYSLAGFQKFIAEHNAGLKASSISAKAAAIGHQLLNAALSMGISLLVSAAISGIQKLINAEKEAAEAARDAASEAQKISEEAKTLQEYKDTIIELRTELDNNALSEADAYDAREKLLEIQKKLIENFGLERDGINLVTGAIEDQIDAIDKLSKDDAQQWINDNRDTIDKAIKTMEGDVTGIVSAWGNGTSFRNWGSTWNVVKMIDDYVADNPYMTSQYSAPIDGTDHVIGFTGNVEESKKALEDFQVWLREKEQEIQGEISELSSLPESEMTSDVQKKIESLKKDLKQLQDVIIDAGDTHKKWFGEGSIYDSNKALYEETQLKTAVAEYTNQYMEILTTQNELQEAMAKGDVDAANAAKSKINSIIDEAIAMAESKGQNYMVEFFNGIRQSNTTIEFDIEYNVGGIRDQVEGIASVLSGLDNNQVLDLADLYEGNLIGREDDFTWDTEGLAYTSSQVDAIEDLHHMAVKAKIPLTELINILTRFGYIQGRPIVDDSEADKAVNLAQTYSSLSSSAEEFNSIQQQTDEILHSGIEVTQEYKDALLELGISEEELKECFDETNPLMVKNASALKQLVGQAKYNTAQNVKMAKSHARLKYANLVKELNKVLDVTGELPAMNRLAAESILSQIDAVETAIYKYTLLEDKLLGVHNAFEKFNEAKETDGLNTYGDSYVEMVQTMYDAHTKTGEYGTEAYQAAVDALISPNNDALQGIEKGTAAYHAAVREILMNEIVPTLTLDGDSLSIDQASMMKFVEENLNGLFTGDLSKFDLNIEPEEGVLLTLEKAAELAGMTETQVYAMLAALKDFTGVDYLSMFDNSTEGQIVNTTQKLEELNRQKLELLKSGVSADSEEIKKLNEEIQKLLGNLDALKVQARGEVTKYETISGLMDQLDGLGDLSEVTKEQLQNAFTDDQKKKLIEMDIDLDADDAQEIMDKLTQQLLLLGGEPTVVTVQYAIEANEDEIQKYKDILAEMDDSGVEEVEIKGVKWDREKINEEIEKLEGQIEGWELKFGITEETTVLEEMEKIESFIINDKRFAVGFKGATYSTTWSQLTLLINKLKELEDTAFSVNATITWSGDDDVNGTAHALGTAFKTGSWGAPRTERALVGELGPELLVRGSKWTTIGENGAEFTNIRKGDIIFNHKQTEDLLSKGYISGRGRSIGSAFASGTAYNNPWGGFLPIMNNNGSGSDGSLSGSKDDEFEEIFDWFEVLLEEINEQLDLMNAKLENAVGIGAKGSLIDQLLNTNHYKIYELAEGIKLYTDYAAKLLQKVPAQYREMAQNGAVEITEFLGEANEETVEAINNYREWAQKVADLNQQLEETKTEVADLAKQKFDVVVDEYDNIISILEAQRDQFDAQISLMEDRGYVAAKVYYESMIQNTRKQSGELEKQKKAMQAVLDEQVRLGNIKVGSEQWYEMIEALYDVDSSIKDCVADLEEYQNALNDIHWENFENLTNRLDYLKEETQSLIDLMDSEDMVITPETDDGWSADQVEWSREGMASLGLYAQQMEIAEYTARQYAEAIDDLNADFRAGKYSESEYQEKLEELTSAQYDSIEAYYDAQEAIQDLHKTRVDSIKEGIEKEIEAYEKLIQKKKEELDADKDLYDFEKSVADQQKNISDIERKLAALSVDNSMSAMAKRKQLEAELAEARASLEESYHDRSVTDQQNALDKELENYKEEKDAEIEKLEEYLEDVKTIVADSLGIIKDNASGIYETLNSKANEYNLTLSDSIVSPWRDGELAVSDYQTAFDTAMSSTTNQLEAMKRKWQELIDKMAKAAQTEINSQQKENNRYVEATPVPTVSNNTTSKAIAVGGKINAGSAPIYADSHGSGASSQYYSSDPIYTVLEEQGGYVLVRHHSLTSGYSGWFKKSDVKGYAKGTAGTKSNELAWIDELGDELVMHADGSGRLSFLTKGTAVIPHDISENLMELGQLDPSDVLSRNTPIISMSPSAVTNNMEVNMSIAEVVHIDTVSNETIPDLTKAIEKQMDKYMKNINNNIRKYAR